MTTNDVDDERADGRLTRIVERMLRQTDCRVARMCEVIITHETLRGTPWQGTGRVPAGLQLVLGILVVQDIVARQNRDAPVVDGHPVCTLYFAVLLSWMKVVFARANPALNTDHSHRDGSQPTARGESNVAVASIEVPKGAPAWVTKELIKKTIDVWQPRYEYPLSADDALEMILNVSRLVDVLELRT